MPSLKKEVFLRDGLLWDLDNLCGNANAIDATVDTKLGEDELDIPLSEKPPNEEEDEKEEVVVEDEDPGVIGKDPWCTLSSYGGASSSNENELKDLIGPDEDGGLLWTAQLVSNDTPIKPRRGMPFPVTTEDFLSSVRRIGKPSIDAHAEAGLDDLWDRHDRQDSSLEPSPEEARWVFHGVLNGWPGLTVLDVQTVRAQEPQSIMKKVWVGTTTSGKGKKIWDVNRDGNERGIELSDAINGYDRRKRTVLLVELRAPYWSSQGWSKRSPGFIFWTEGPTVDGGSSSSSSNNLTMNYGTDIIKNTIEERDPACTMVHMINHRYASPKKPESPKDRLAYHSLVLLEWDHQKYCSVVEIGFLNGLGGYKGKSNWFEDKDAKPHSALYAAFAPEMVLPWKSTLSEIRVTNVPFRNKDDFMEHYMNKYEGHQGRFVDTNCSFSHEVRLSFHRRSHIATYLVNYILRDKTYSEMKRNCQTFAADLCGFLAGKRNISPYHPVNQIQYHNSTHTFLYESSKYSTTKKKKSMSFLG